MSSFLVKVSLICMVTLFAHCAEAKISRAMQNFGCEEILNVQLKWELEASQVYLSLVRAFDVSQIFK